MSLNPRQKRFAELYVATGNGAQSYKDAGYEVEGSTAEVNASRLLSNAKVIDYIKEITRKPTEKRIASAEDIKNFLTETMMGEDIDLKHRLKAAELIARASGLFIERRQVETVSNAMPIIEVIEDVR